MISVTATKAFSDPPRWAMLERELIARLEQSIDVFLAKYVLPDGTLRWGGTGAQHGRDDKDDFYEAFYNWPLLYLLGGDERLLAIARRQWKAVTRQLTELGLLHDEFDVGADFFHQGEGLTFFYLLCLADPTDAEMVARAQRFARLYVDSEAGNYSPVNRLIRAPHTGSRGPAWGYGDPNRSVALESGMAVYGLPFHDVAGVASFDDIADPQANRRMVAAMERRFGRGDVPANLGATSLATLDYLLTGNESARLWVIDYVGAWMERAAQNGGVIPDNVALDGTIGAEFEGRWFGGLYGWTWPHGLYAVGQSTAIAAMNAALLSQDARWFDLPRAQLDAVIALGRVADIRSLEMSLVHHWLPALGFDSVDALRAAPEPVETFIVPYRHGQDGWFDFQPLLPTLAATLWSASMDANDRLRLDQLRDVDGVDWSRSDGKRHKEDSGHEGPWLEWLAGRNAEYPERAFADALQHVEDRLAAIRGDTTDLTRVSDSVVHTLVHHWQKMNPVTTEALVQLTWGAPQHLYNGGLPFACLRFHDAVRRRSGLPRDVAALVSAVDADMATFELVNLHATEQRCVLVQGGMYGEHGIVSASLGAKVVGEAAQPSAAYQWLEVILPPRHRAVVDVVLARNVHRPMAGPSYPPSRQGGLPHPDTGAL